jgi:cyanate lyase
LFCFELLQSSVSPLFFFGQSHVLWSLSRPNTYRLYEAICHNGEAIKSLINEQCGDGIMSAIDFYLDVRRTVGVNGEKRVVLTFNGKFLPFIEQKSANNTAVEKE